VELRQTERLSIPEHGHEKALISLLLGGTYTERFRSRRLDHEPFALAFHPEGMEHRDEAGAGMRMLVIELEPDGPLRHFTEVAARPPRLLESLVALSAVFSLRAELVENGLACAATCEGLLFDLLSDVDREARARDEKRPRWLAEVLDRLRSSYREDVSFATVAADAGVHVGHLWRVFRRAEGCSPSTYLHRLRCRHVVNRLAQPGDPLRLADLALEAGFSDQSHLNRVFKRMTGTAPGALRASLRSQTRQTPGDLV
jgi:AraC family transcriptional regulator